MGNNEPDDLELSRRMLADLEELNVEFHIGMDQVLTKLHTAEEGLKVEAMGMAPRTFGDDTPLKLRDAIYLPILGGEVLRNGTRTPSPTFKVSFPMSSRYTPTCGSRISSLTGTTRNPLPGRKTPSSA